MKRDLAIQALKMTIALRPPQKSSIHLRIAILFARTSEVPASTWLQDFDVKEG
jgi:hypothetical protein